MSWDKENYTAATTILNPKCETAPDGTNINPKAVLVAFKYIYEGWLTIGKTLITYEQNNEAGVGYKGDGIHYVWADLEDDGSLRESWVPADSGGGYFTYDIVACRKYRWN